MWTFKYWYIWSTDQRIGMNCEMDALTSRIWFWSGVQTRFKPCNGWPPIKNRKRKRPLRGTWSISGYQLLHGSCATLWRLVRTLHWVSYAWTIVIGFSHPTRKEQIRQLSEPFVLKNKKFKRVSITGKIQDCIASDIIEDIISEAHKHEGTHFNHTTTWQYILRTPYWWPTRRRDVLAYCQECPVYKIANKR